MLGFRRLVVAGLVGAAAMAWIFQAGAFGARSGADAPNATAAQGRVLLLYNRERGRYKPSRVIVTCADSNFRVRNIVWSSWTADEARGRGTALVNDCDPDCAGGTFRRYPVRLRAFGPRLTGGCVPRSMFTRLGWRLPQGKPEGPRQGTAKFVCPRAAHRRLDRTGRIAGPRASSTARTLRCWIIDVPEDEDFRPAELLNPVRLQAPSIVIRVGCARHVRPP